VLCVFVGAWFFGSQPASVRADIRAADFLAQEKQSIHSSGHESPGALAQNARAEKANPRARAAVQQFMAGPSVFIENAGQWADGSIRFALDGSGANVGLTDQGPRFQLFRKTSTTSTTFTPSTPGQALEKSAPAPTEMHEFAVVFDGAARVAPAGRGKSDRTFNYLMGDVTNHREGVSSFNSVWYEGLYPGVSLELTGSRTGIKYNFHVAPGADWRAIRVKYDGVEGLSLRPDGALEIRIAEGWDALADAAPYIYQEVNGEKVTVAGRFVLFHGHTYGFEVTGACDSSLPLIIDPGHRGGFERERLCDGGYRVHRLGERRLGHDLRDRPQRRLCGEAERGGGAPVVHVPGRRGLRRRQEHRGGFERERLRDGVNRFVGLGERGLGHDLQR
jgi:hypothetical protein